jgi:mono/diheme cytochrome c family protein
MRLRDLILSSLLVGIGLLRLLTGSPSSNPSAEASHRPQEAHPDRRNLVIKTVVGTILIGVFLLGAAGAIFIYSGLYPMAADLARYSLTRELFAAMKMNYVQRYARRVEAPQLRDARLVQQGVVLHREHCLVCHGAPGVRSEQIGRGIDPFPPDLSAAVPRWTDAEVYWILTHGLRMSGMPSFGVVLSEPERWALVAFLRQLPWLSPFEYRRWVAAIENEKPEAVEWLIEDGRSIIRLAEEGNPGVGRDLIRRFGCGACHVIPGVALGTVGPPLADFAERQYIAGTVANTPDNLVAWIVNPQRINPKTAMPNMGVTPDEAFHMAAYLYNLSESARLAGLRREK